MHSLTTNTRSLFAIAALALTVGCTGGTLEPGGGGGGGGGGGADSGSGTDPDPDPGVCPVPDPTPATPGAKEAFSEAALLKDLAENVVFPVYQRFQARAQTLECRVAAYCGATGDTAAKTAAQDAWKAAIETWQHAELFQFNLQTTTLEGRTQRDIVYSWPAVSPCQIDTVIAQGYAANNFNIGSQTSDGRGLWAVEYALFSDASDCAGSPADAAVLEARCKYALAAAEDLTAKAGQYVTDWTPGSGTRHKDFVNIGSGAFATTTAALTSMYHGMFYFDKKTWELKLNQTSGAAEVKNNLEANANCTKKTACPEALESQYAQVSKDHIINNLNGFEMMFRGLTLAGEDRLGFDDFMTSKAGNPAEIVASIADSRALLVAIPGTLDSAIESGDKSPATASKEMKNITGGMKSDVADATGLAVPASAAGDGD